MTNFGRTHNKISSAKLPLPKDFGLNWCLWIILPSQNGECWFRELCTPLSRLTEGNADTPYKVVTWLGFSQPDMTGLKTTTGGRLLCFHVASQVLVFLFFCTALKVCLRRCLVKWHRGRNVYFGTLWQPANWRGFLTSGIWLRNSLPNLLAGRLAGWSLERKETSSFPPLCWAGKDGL